VAAIVGGIRTRGRLSDAEIGVIVPSPAQVPAGIAAATASM
jgi:hypothetical protein